MAGVQRQWIAPENFVQIHFDLIDMGLSLEAALLLHRIYFRSNIGSGWWLATKAEMQADTRLSERKLDRAVTELRERGMIEWRRQNAQNPTLAWRLLWANDGEGRNRPSAEGRNVPQEEDETSFTSTKNGKKNNPSSSDDDAVVAEQFADWWQVYPKKVDRKKAEQAFAKAVKRVGYDTLRSGLIAYVKALRSEGKVTVTSKQVGDETKIQVQVAGDAKVLNPTTWLNGDRWEDQHQEAAPAAQSGDEENSWMHRTE